MISKFGKVKTKVIFFILVSLLLSPLYLTIVYQLVKYILIGINPKLVIGTDFISYLTGGLMVRKGFGNEIYNLDRQYIFQLKAIEPLDREYVLPFKNPPIVAVLFIPFTFFSVIDSYRLFIVFNFVFLAIITIYLATIFPKINKIHFWYFIPFLYLGSLATVVIGQISFWLVFIFSYAYKALKEKKDFYLGFVLGFILIKPQYIISIPYFFLLSKKRNSFLKGFFLSIIIFIFINFLISGIQPLIEYPRFILATETPFYGSKVDQMITINSVMQSLLKPFGIKNIYSIIINLCLYFASLFIFAKKKLKMRTDYLYIAILILSLLFAVHVNVYDLSILIIAIFILINLAYSKKGKDESFIFTLAFSLFFLPLIIFIFNPFIGTAALVLLIFFLFFKNQIIIKIKKINWGALFVLIIFLTLWFIGKITIDPDFGWRLQSGLLYLQKGIPKTDPFSYTMPSFPWVDHAWLVTTGIGFLYPIIGKIGLAFISSLLAISALIISSSREKKSVNNFPVEKVLGHHLGRLASISFILSVSLIMPFSGVRAQVFTWFLLAVFLKILLNNQLWQRWKKVLPVFFFIWANLHGGFVSGLAILCLVLFVRFVREEKIVVVDILILFFSICATFFNPYGIGLWREVWSSVTDSSLRWSIAEWMPSFFMLDLSMISLVSLSFILITKYRKKFTKEELVLYYFSLIQGILSRRNLPLWIIISLPLLNDAINYFYQEVKGIRISLFRLKKVYKYAWYLFLVIFTFQTIFTLKNSLILTENRFYPKDAVNYLKINLPENETFSLYGWGGYLIWQLPEKKVFIDGRMPSWNWDKAGDSESNNSFEEYKGILTGETDYKILFEKYKIDTVLWPISKPPGFYTYLQKKLDNFLTIFGKEKSDFDFLKQLEDDGWDEIYKDNVAIIFSNRK